MKKAILIRIDEDVYEVLKKENENISSLIRTLLNEYLATKKLQKELPVKIEKLEHSIDMRLQKMERTLLEGLQSNRFELAELNQTLANFKKGLAVIAYWVAENFYWNFSRLFCVLKQKGTYVIEFQHIWQSIASFSANKVMRLFGGYDPSNTIYELRNSPELEELDKMMEEYKKALQRLNN